MSTVTRERIAHDQATVAEHVARHADAVALGELPVVEGWAPCWHLTCTVCHETLLSDCA